MWLHSICQVNEGAHSKVWPIFFSRVKTNQGTSLAQIPQKRPSINQSINQPTNQPSNQSINQSINQNSNLCSLYSLRGMVETSWNACRHKKWLQRVWQILTPIWHQKLRKGRCFGGAKISGTQIPNVNESFYITFSDFSLSGNHWEVTVVFFQAKNAPPLALKENPPLANSHRPSTTSERLWHNFWAWNSLGSEEIPCEKIGFEHVFVFGGNFSKTSRTCYGGWLLRLSLVGYTQLLQRWGWWSNVHRKMWTKKTWPDTNWLQCWLVSRDP